MAMKTAKAKSALPRVQSENMEKRIDEALSTDPNCIRNTEMWQDLAVFGALYALRKDRAQLGTFSRRLHASEQSINRTTVAQCRLNPSFRPLSKPLGIVDAGPLLHRFRGSVALCLCKRISPIDFRSRGSPSMK
jgi:hypothetical protein